MKLVVSGGGTGGHVYPALEVAKAFQEQGDEAHYFGSFRGHEATVCPRVGVPFKGFPSEPLYSLKTVRGIKAAVQLTRSAQMARKALKELGAEVVFATGGYSAAPVLIAARKLGIPYVVHEQNVVPGRSITMVAKQAYCVLTTFKAGNEHFAGCQIRRVGLPLRKAFRQGGQASLNFDQARDNADINVIAMGGSQGASALNEVVLATVVRMSRYSVRWLHLSGVTHFDEIQQTANKLGVHSHYQVRAFLDGDEMANSIFTSNLAVCRSGAGTLCELAAFRKPSILIPFPASFGNHQYFNAKEFEDMGAAMVLPQKDLQPSDLESRILLWMNEPDRIARARDALADWDKPDALSHIIKILTAAAHRQPLP